MQIIIGTRASPLAMAQANEVKNRLEANPQLRPILHPLTTKGDKFIDRPLAEIGGKGLFTHELNAGLDAGVLQIAVHSMKDLETTPYLKDTSSAPYCRVKMSVMRLFHINMHRCSICLRGVPWNIFFTSWGNMPCLAPRFKGG